MVRTASSNTLKRMEGRAHNYALSKIEHLEPLSMMFCPQVGLEAEMEGAV